MRKSPSEETKPKAIIKKYSDRRLYDSKASRYVTLDDVARMVRDGIEVKVVDARTGKDLTYLVLTQIILEDARRRETPLPLQLLEQLVRASDKATHEFLSWYLKSTLELYQKAQDTVRTRFPEATAAMARPIDFVRKLLEKQTWPPPSPADDIAELEQLQGRLETLQARLEQSARDLPRKKKSRSKSKTKAETA